MANTKQGIYYPDNYNLVADVPEDMKKMAESVDAEIGKDRERLTKNESDIKNIQEKDTAQDENIETLTQRLNEKDNQIAELEDKVSDLNNNQIHGKASGEYVHLSDSAKMECDIAVLGNSKQETREGYNLLKNNATSQTINGVTFTVNEDGTVTANGTATNTSYIAVNSFLYVANQDYVLSGCPNSGSDNTYKMYSINISSGAGHTNDYGEGGAIKVSADQVGEIRIRIASGYTANNLVFKPMLVAGTENKEYEQYGVMPSLDYPSEIQCVGDNVNVLDFTNYQSFTASNVYLAIKANGFNLKANIDYIFSYSADGDFSTSNALKLWFRDANNSNFKEVLANIPFSLTEEELNKLSYIQVVFQRIKAGNSYAGHIYAKIEKGKKATAYSTYGYGNVNVKVCNDKDNSSEEYEEQNYSVDMQEPFRAIGDVRDCFVLKEDGKWYERHNVARYILTGKETVAEIDTIKGINYFKIIIPDLLTNFAYINDKTIQYNCNYFKAIKIVDRYKDNTMFINIDKNLIICSNNFTTIDELKTKLVELYNEGTPVYVDYVVTTPIDIECTETQKAQLQSLQKAKTYKNITNITTDTIAVLDVDYKKDLETIINNMQAQILAG